MYCKVNGIHLAMMNSQNNQIEILGKILNQKGDLLKEKDVFGSLQAKEIGLLRKHISDCKASIATTL